MLLSQYVCYSANSPCSRNSLQRIAGDPPLPADLYRREFLGLDHFPHLLSAGLQNRGGLLYGVDLYL